MYRPKIGGREIIMKHTSYNKLSKKAKRAEDAKHRVTWSINPVTRKPKNPKAYDRNREKAYSRNEEYANSTV